VSVMLAAQADHVSLTPQTRILAAVLAVLFMLLILDLIRRIKDELDMAVIMITHDLGVVAEMADDIAVMYAGRIVERASATKIFEAPEHPYTWGLLRSIPRLDTPRDEPLVPIPGRPPSLINLPTGCSFHPRCPYATEQSKTVEPALEPVPGDREHVVACTLDPDERRRLWAELKSGADPEQARARVREGIS